MKKIVIFGAIIIVIFGALAYVTSYSNKQQSVDNPFGKEKLNPETIKQLNNPIYQNIILPEELDEKLANGEDVTVYFYSPLCNICNETSPIIVPKAEELEIDLYLYNILEFEQGWDDFEITGTPTIIHFNEGVELARISGGHDEAMYEQFYNQVVLGE